MMHILDNNGNKVTIYNANYQVGNTNGEIDYPDLVMFEPEPRISDMLLHVDGPPSEETKRLVEEYILRTHFIGYPNKRTAMSMEQEMDNSAKVRALKTKITDDPTARFAMRRFGYSISVMIMKDDISIMFDQIVK